jgi:predicted TIM-barrel fold metal-dependent hydrolase
VYVDTSGIASSRNKGIETVVEKVGSERILFGTDTYASGFQRGRIEYALIDEIHKENILRNNALRLFAKKFNA